MESVEIDYTNYDSDMDDGVIVCGCPSCGKHYAFFPDSKFCSMCGISIIWKLDEHYERGLKRLNLTHEEAQELHSHCTQVNRNVIATYLINPFIEKLKSLPHKALYTKEAQRRYGTKYMIYEQRNKFINKLFAKYGIDFKIEDNGISY